LRANQCRRRCAKSAVITLPPDQMRQKRVDVNPIADLVANWIAKESSAPCLKWYPDGRVKVIIGKVIPDQGGRRRFRTALESLLHPQGWRTVGTYTYAKSRKETKVCSNRSGCDEPKDPATGLRREPTDRRSPNPRPESKRL